MKPTYMTIPALKTSGRVFLKLLDSVDSSDPEVALLAKTALAALDARGFSKPPKDKTAKSHHVTGKALFAALDQTTQARSSATGKVGDAGNTVGKTAKALKAWLRDLHRLLAAIKRADSPDALVSLPLLGELELTEGLRSSAQQLIAFLARPDVLHAVGDYQVAEADRVKGEQVLAAWEKALASLGGLRGVRSKNTESDVQAREKFAAWLTKWHEFALVALQDDPAVLKALGVDVPRARSGRPRGKAVVQGTALGIEAVETPIGTSPGVVEPG